MKGYLVQFIVALALFGCAAPRVKHSSSHTRYQTREVAPKNNLSPTKNLKQVEARDVRVALLLPLSGPSEKIGKDLLNSSMLALYDMNNSNISIIPIDTKGTAMGANIAAKKALNKNVDIILGPFFSFETEVVAQVVKDSGVNVISFSNTKKLSSDNVFIFGFLVEEQVRNAANYALRQGRRNFACLLPNDSYGSVIEKEIRSIIEGNNGTVRVEFYPADGKNIQRYVGRIVDNYNVTYFLDKNGREVHKAIHEGEDAIYEKRQRTIDTLFVPAGSIELYKILALLHQTPVMQNDTMLLGSGKWEDENIFKNPYAIGGIFAAPSMQSFKDFESYFYKIYGYMPMRIATLSYDATSLIAFLNSQGLLAKQSLYNKEGFIGIDGPFRFNRLGVVERQLSIFKIVPNKYEMIENGNGEFK